MQSRNSVTSTWAAGTISTMEGIVMKKKRILLSLMLVLTLVFFTGCGSNDSVKDEDTKDQPAVEQSENENEGEQESAENQQAESKEDVSEGDAQVEEVNLYIGIKGGDFKKVPVEIESKYVYAHNFDEHLLAAIADETGWKLTLANPIEDVEGGKTIEFTDDSAFAVGPPEKQKDDYFVYDNMSFTQMMLDSIQKTFDMNLTDGNPQRSLNLYFSQMGKNIQVENLTIPKDKPWNEARALTFEQ